MEIEEITVKIEGIRSQLDRADVQQRSEAQIGMTMIAVSQLLDLVEALAQRQEATDRRIDAIGRSLRAIADRDE
jgi:hypothetical protein